MPRLLVLLFFIPVAFLQAGEVQHATVTHEKGIYTVDLEMMIEANQSVVWKIVNDHNQIAHLSDLVKESQVISRQQDRIRRRLVTNACILIFCFDAIIVEDVNIIGDTIIHTTIDASQSDFEFGMAEWRILPEGSSCTRIQYHSEIKPDFWIPPLIGPLLIKHKMLGAAKQIMNRLEILAANG